MSARTTRQQHPPPHCPCGNCTVRHGFCSEHTVRLAAIREDYLHGWKRKLSSVGNGGRKKAGRPCCCFHGCYEPRQQGQSFCWEHEQESVE